MESLKIKIEKEDIKAPELQDGETAIVFARHEKYDRERNTETSGSLVPESAEEFQNRTEDFFSKILSQKPDNVVVLFVASDTQYNGMGRRSLETSERAQEAAIKAMEAAGVDPTDHIINFSPSFNTKRSSNTRQNLSVRPDARLSVEPKFLDESPDYVAHLQDKYGAQAVVETKGGEMRRNGLSVDAWVAHETDAEKETREALGAEGVGDILTRAQRHIAVLERYAELFHAKFPEKRLVIWSSSHYDTISPFVKNATDMTLDDHVPVDYGAGIVIKIDRDKEATFDASGHTFKIGQRAGKVALGSS